MLAITGATGQLGRDTLQHLSTKVAAGQLAAVVRDPQKAAAQPIPSVELR